MATDRPTLFLRLLTQEREALAALRQLTGELETALVSGDSAAIQDISARAGARLQREARISSHLAAEVHAAQGMPALLASLPEELRTQAEALLGELAGHTEELRRLASRLTALAEAGSNRITFIYQALARAQEQPQPYRNCRAGVPTPATAIALLSRQV